MATSKSMNMMYDIYLYIHIKIYRNKYRYRSGRGGMWGRT